MIDKLGTIATPPRGERHHIALHLPGDHISLASADMNSAKGLDDSVTGHFKRLTGEDLYTYVQWLAASNELWESLE